MEYLILKRIIIDKEEDWKTEIQLCTIPELKHSPQIRFCYYTKQKRKSGTPFWNLAPRATAFDIANSKKIIDAIQELTLLYTAIANSVKSDE